jgi:hypothetical protein
MSIHNTINDMQKHASIHGGKCLSKEYWDDISRLMWMCDKGHVWELPWRFIKQGAWCPACEKEEERKGKEIIRKEKCLDKIRLLAKERGGECLSKEFINNKTKMQFHCAEGHLWSTCSGAIVNGSWCPVCAIKRNAEKQLLPFEIYKKIAIERGGKLLSDKSEYKTGRSNLLWECSKGHQWYASGADVKNSKHWCAQCLGMIKTIEDMHELATKQGGRCLSETYINSITKLEWQCSEGHIWKATPQSISSKSWCPICGIEKVHRQQRNDIEIYQKIANERGGKLLSEVYINKAKKLLWECGKGHQWYAQPASIKNSGQWCPSCAGKLRKTINEMQELAAKKGGKCLSEEYINTKTKLEWQCGKGHVWKSCPTNIIADNWCPVCGIESRSQKAKDDIELYRNIAIEKGGKLLSDSYINGQTPLLWECNKGHQWKAAPALLKYQDSWCPLCRGRIKTIEYMQELAAKRGGKCLSTEYKGYRTKLKWQCTEGHIWKATYKSAMKVWCAACKNKTTKIHKNGIEK